METGPCYEATPQLVLHSDDNLTLIPWGTGAPSERYTHIAGSIDRSDVIIFCQNTVGQKSIKKERPFRVYSLYCDFPLSSGADCFLLLTCLSTAVAIVIGGCFSFLFYLNFL